MSCSGPQKVSRHTADGDISPSIKRLTGVVASATTAGTRAVTCLNVPVPAGVYVDITTFVGTVYVYGG
jgi:hypothetical protein